MSGTYWSVGTNANISQTDVEIKCEGADQFKENQTVGIFIPPSVGFFSGKDSTLNFDVEIKYPSGIPTKWSLDSVTGARIILQMCCVRRESANHSGNFRTLQFMVFYKIFLRHE